MFEKAVHEFHSNGMMHMATLDLQAHPLGWERYFPAGEIAAPAAPSLHVFHKGHLITTETHVEKHGHADLVRVVTVDRFREAHGELEAEYGRQKYMGVAADPPSVKVSPGAAGGDL